MEYPRGFVFVVALLAVSGVGQSEPLGDQRDKIEATCSVQGKAQPKPTVKRWLKNGDFLIVKNVPTQDLAGDGIDEFTVWSFDFRDHPKIEKMLSDDYKISRAYLELVLTPMAHSADTDAVFIQTSVCNWSGRKFHILPSREDLTPGEQMEINYDLIEHGYYTSAELKYFLRISGKGTDKYRFSFERFLDTDAGDLPMILHDDSIISEATLTLEFNQLREDEGIEVFPPPGEDPCEPIPPDQYPGGCTSGSYGD